MISFSLCMVVVLVEYCPFIPLSANLHHISSPQLNTRQGRSWNLSEDSLILMAVNSECVVFVFHTYKNNFLSEKRKKLQVFFSPKYLCQFRQIVIKCFVDSNYLCLMVVFWCCLFCNVANTNPVILPTL